MAAKYASNFYHIDSLRLYSQCQPEPRLHFIGYSHTAMPILCDTSLTGALPDIVVGTLMPRVALARQVQAPSHMHWQRAQCIIQLAWRCEPRSCRM